MFFLFVAGVILFISPLRLRGGLMSEITLLSTWVILFLFFLTSALLTITNLYTLIFFIEFVNLLVFLLLICSYSNQQSHTNTETTSPFILFFWINALSSIVLFLLLLISSQFGWFSMFTQVTGISFLTLSFFKTNWFLLFVFFAFIFIFFLKLGLPPFIFWKLRIFENVPFWFIALYNIPYFLFVLVSLLNIITLLYTILPPAGPFFVFFVFFVFGLFVPLIFSAPNVAYFLTMSSGLTVLFLMLFLSLNTMTAVSADWAVSAISSLYIYLLIYSFIILLLVILFNSLALHLNPNSGSYPLTIFLNHGTTAQKNHFRAYLLFPIINLAGLPPFLVFFCKPKIIVEFFTSGVGYLPLTLVLVFYLFISIFFIIARSGCFFHLPVLFSSLSLK
uniref:NADH dehydrogenase subunit 2 n=1 Tax=Euplotes crassus TaxID=5936 RepID=D1LDS8_EUPCR|nr:NADH dehydrogenase subunit 2 [Moneuplotes crassus]